MLQDSIDLEMYVKLRAARRLLRVDESTTDVALENALLLLHQSRSPFTLQQDDGFLYSLPLLKACGRAYLRAYNGVRKFADLNAPIRVTLREYYEETEADESAMKTLLDAMEDDDSESCWRVVIDGRGRCESRAREYPYRLLVAVEAIPCDGCWKRGA